MWRLPVVLLIAWLLGVLGLYSIGDLVHVLLFVGLMPGLLGLLESRRRGSSWIRCRFRQDMTTFNVRSFQQVRAR